MQNPRVVLQGYTSQQSSAADCDAADVVVVTVAVGADA